MSRYAIKQKKSDDGVRVYNTKLFAELCRGVPEDRPISQQPDKVKLTHQQIRQQRIKEHYLEHAEAEKKKAAERLEDKLKAAKARRDAKFEALYKKIEAGQELVDSIDEYIKVSDEADLQKKEQLYSNWESQVFHNIQRAVGKSLESIDRKALNKRRREEFQKFLDISNSKGGLFLDTIVDDYDPLVANKMATKTRTKKLFDPTKRLVDKHQEEDKLLSGGKATYEPKEREILEANQWAAGKIEATPHGHFAKFIGKVHKPTEMQKKITASDVPWDHYDYPKDGYTPVGGLKIFAEKNNNHTYDIA